MRKHFTITGSLDFWIWAIALFLGLGVGLGGQFLLQKQDYYFGNNTIGIIITGTIPLVTQAYFTLNNRINKLTILKSIILFFLILLPYYSVFFQKMTVPLVDDFGRYIFFAKNMIQNNTLWGGDALYYEEVSGLHLATQPGYRYYTWIQLLLFKDTYRIMQLSNILLIIIVYGFLFYSFSTCALNPKIRKSIIILCLLSAPYVLTNSLIGIPEWITSLLLFGAIYFLIKQSKYLFIICLSSVPFFRQNLLISVILLFILSLYYFKDKIVPLLIIFIGILLIPVYHNLYYAKTFRFFTDIFKYPFLIYNDQNQVIDFNYLFIISNLSHYIGFDIIDFSLKFSILAILFIPFYIYVFQQLSKHLTAVNLKLTYWFINLSYIIPSILFANVYYPRFELLNIPLAILTFFLLYQLNKKLISPSY